MKVIFVLAILSCLTVLHSDFSSACTPTTVRESDTGAGETVGGGESEGNSDSNPEPSLGFNPGTGPGTNPGTEPGNNPGIRPGTNPGTGPGTNPGTEPGNNPGTEPGTNPGTNPGTEPGNNPGTEPGTNPGTEPGTNPGTNPGTEPGTNPDTNPGTEPGNNPGTRPGNNPGTEPGTNPGTNPGTEPGNSTEPVSSDELRCREVCVWIYKAYRGGDEPNSDDRNRHRHPHRPGDGPEVSDQVAHKLKDCVGTCMSESRCGDNVQHQLWERCDDGNSDIDDACPKCLRPSIPDDDEENDNTPVDIMDETVDLRRCRHVCGVGNKDPNWNAPNFDTMEGCMGTCLDESECGDNRKHEYWEHCDDDTDSCKNCMVVHNVVDSIRCNTMCFRGISEGNTNLPSSMVECKRACQEESRCGDGEKHKYWERCEKGTEGCINCMHVVQPVNMDAVRCRGICWKALFNRGNDSNVPQFETTDECKRTCMDESTCGDGEKHEYWEGCEEDTEGCRNCVYVHERPPPLDRDGIRCWHMCSKVMLNLNNDSSLPQFESLDDCKETCRNESTCGDGDEHEYWEGCEEDTEGCRNCVYVHQRPPPLDRDGIRCWHMCPRVMLNPNDDASLPQFESMEECRETCRNESTCGDGDQHEYWEACEEDDEGCRNCEYIPEKPPLVDLDAIRCNHLCSKAMHSRDNDSNIPEFETINECQRTCMDESACGDGEKHEYWEACEEDDEGCRNCEYIPEKPPLVDLDAIRCNHLCSKAMHSRDNDSNIPEFETLNECQRTCMDESTCGDGEKHEYWELCEDDTDACKNCMGVVSTDDLLPQLSDIVLKTRRCEKICRGRSLIGLLGDVIGKLTCARECLEADNVCGDGQVDRKWERCDDGNDDNDDRCVNCLEAVCGDRFVFANVEECDDGNRLSGDGCDADCQNEEN